MALTDGRVSASLFYFPLERSGVPRKGLTNGTMSQEAETAYVSAQFVSIRLGASS